MSKEMFNIKARAAQLGVKLQEVWEKVRENGVDCQYSNFNRARIRDVKTAKDMEILNAADAVLRKLEEMEGAQLCQTQE